MEPEGESVTISKKLYAAFGMTLVLTLSLGITAWLSLTHIGNEASVSSKSTRKLQLACEMTTLTSNMFSAERGMVVRTLLKDEAKLEYGERSSIRR